MLNIDGCPQATDIFGDIVAEYDVAHRRFPRATFAHQKNLLLLLFELGTVHCGGSPTWKLKGIGSICRDCNRVTGSGMRKVEDLQHLGHWRIRSKAEAGGSVPALLGIAQLLAV